MSAHRQQPAPIPTDGVDVWALAIREATARGASKGLLARMAARRELGIERYGTPLQLDNGRDNLRDVLEEALDLVAYTRAECLKHPEDKRRRHAHAWACATLELLHVIASSEGR